MNEKLIAKVDGRMITEADLNALIQNLGPNASRFANADGRKKLIEELVTQELFYSDAVENGLDKEEAFVVALEQMKSNLLKQYALNKLLSNITVSDEEARAHFDQNPDMFKAQPSARASHILVQTQEEADSIAKEIAEGLAFEDAAVKYSLCPSKERGGDLGEFSTGQMVPEFEQAVFAMKDGDISAPVQTQFGFHLIKAVAIKDAPEVKFEEVIDQVKNYCASVKTNVVYAEKQAELKQKYAVEMIEA
ncbi:MAG: peptidylprolyl isomerase [Cellulosilyticaceae bacterium]